MLLVPPVQLKYSQNGMPLPIIRLLYQSLSIGADKYAHAAILCAACLEPANLLSVQKSPFSSPSTIRGLAIAASGP